MPKKIFSEEEKNQIIKLYTKDKIGSNALGKQFGCSGPTILKNLKEWGISPNTKKLDLTNQKFGELTVLKPAPKRNDKYTRWICKCDCGKEVEVRTDYLTSHHTISCGHIKEEIFKAKDLIGQQFGYLTVLKRIPPNEQLCKCKCGTITKVKTANLTNGTTKSCGCYQKEQASKASFKSLVGQKFGQLEVLERVENNYRNEVCYRCKCECGGETIATANNLRGGHTNSCGCIKSKGEMLINKWLQEHNVLFQNQYGFEDIFLESGRRPFYDFCIFNEDKSIKCIIEYNGKQHYEITGGWNTKECFEITQNRDKQKIEALKNKNIPLYTISYLDNIEDKLNEIFGENK